MALLAFLEWGGIIGRNWFGTPNVVDCLSAKGSHWSCLVSRHYTSINGSGLSDIKYPLTSSINNHF